MKLPGGRRSAAEPSVAAQRPLDPKPPSPLTGLARRTACRRQLDRPPPRRARRRRTASPGAGRCGRPVRPRTVAARIGVQQQHPDLAAVSRVDQPRRVDQRDPVLRAPGRSAAAPGPRGRAGSRPRSRCRRWPAPRARSSPAPRRAGRGRRRPRGRGWEAGRRPRSRRTRSSTCTEPRRGSRRRRLGSEPVPRPFRAKSANLWASAAGMRALTSTPSARSSRSRSPASSCSSARRPPSE